MFKLVLYHFLTVLFIHLTLNLLLQIELLQIQFHSIHIFEVDVFIDQLEELIDVNIGLTPSFQFLQSYFILVCEILVQK